MNDNFAQLITGLSISPISTDILYQIILVLQQQTDETLSSFVSQSFQSLLLLERWAWELLSRNSSSSWVDESHYQEFFYTLAFFNKKIVYHYDNIEVDTKASLLFPTTIDQIHTIFQQIEQSTDDNHPYITIVSLWFDNHSYFLHDNPHYNKLCISDHINQSMARCYVMNEQFKFYFIQLRHSSLSETLFTAKMLFYIKTCLCSLFSYLGAKIHQFPYTPKEMLRYLSDDYLQIIHVHHHTVTTWNKNFLACIGHLMAVVAKCYWLDERNGTSMKILFPTEKIRCDHVNELIDILAHKPFHKEIQITRSNDETILIDSILMLLMNMVQIENIHWFFRSNLTIQNTILTVTETSFYDEICLRAYTILGEVLTDEQLKELNIADTMACFLFKMLEQAWLHPSKKYKQIPMKYLLKDFQTLSRNDCIQQTTANLNKLPFLVTISEQYPIVYHILWTLSFNGDIQQQLHSSPSFMSKLLHQAKECDNEWMRKTIHGILWNLDNKPTTDIHDEEIFDIMISYSHRDKDLCKQIYTELSKVGYHVWIDFDQMHGNIMDAMAQAIERSHTIIICMSEQYRRSNYCRAEAHYAFQRQRKIVPVLLQKHYQPDGWLLFLLGQLLYVNFTEQDFSRAIDMLLKELQAENSTITLPSTRTLNILEWTQTQVQNWLMEHNLIQIGRLFADCDGRSLVYLHQYLKNGDLRSICTSLQEDSLRHLNQNLSFLELSRFQALMDRQNSHN